MQPTWLHRALSRRYWSKALAEGGIRTWMAEPVARRYINRRIAGDPHCWPLDWFKDRFASQGFRNALSLGCGEGALERDLRRKEICQRVLGLDLSPPALDLARRQAAREDLSGIAYQVADLNRLELEGEIYDLALFHQSLHHVRDLDHCMAQVARALEPGGYVYLDEYVGPSRDEWDRHQLAVAREVYVQLPGRFRRTRRLGYPVNRRDPSEAVRSSRILAIVERYFRISERRDYGGNLLSVIYPYLRFDRSSPGQKNELLSGLLDHEDQLLEAGEASFYAVVVAIRA
jgi:SAM-dependent methyltransferase